MLGFTGLCLLAGVADAAIMLANLREWYGQLARPPAAPPVPLPGAVWAGLGACYLSLALAAWQIWRQPFAGSRQRAAMQAWGWLLALGAAWPSVFFGLHALPAALLPAAGLAASAGLTVWRFARLDRLAGLLLLPFFGFALAALYLGTGFWWLNR